MNVSNKTLALAVGSAFLLSVGTASFAAGQNPFAAKTLSSGYQVADADMKKMKDGKCGTGKCGANKKKAEEKAAEGSCHGDMKAKEGSCHGDMAKGDMTKEGAAKDKEMSCSADMKDKEGSCHADKK